MDNTKFKVGDQVRCINYGHISIVNKELLKMQEDFDINLLNNALGTKKYKPDYHNIDNVSSSYIYDSHPEYINRKMIINKAEQVQGIDQYSVNHEYPGMHLAWWHNDQLELVYRPKYNK